MTPELSKNDQPQLAAANIERSFMLHHALQYLDLGWSVIPLIGKQPALAWSQYQRNTATSEQVHSWFGAGNPKAYNLGLICKGLIVVDCDTRDEALWFWKSVASSTLVCETGRGFHLYFRSVPETESIGNKVQLFGRKIDLRAGSRGYVVAPASIHASGKPYSWVVGGDFENFSIKELPVFDPKWLPKPQVSTQANSRKLRVQWGGRPAGRGGGKTAGKGSLDYRALRKLVGIDQVLQALAPSWQPVTTSHDGQQLRGPCPAHKSSSEKSTTFSVNLERNAFRCFSAKCQAAGNQLDLARLLLREDSLYRASLVLCHELGLKPPLIERKN